jgi:hypothetical protein
MKDLIFLLKISGCTANSEQQWLTNIFTGYPISKTLGPTPPPDLVTQISDLLSKTVVALTYRTQDILVSYDTVSLFAKVPLQRSKSVPVGSNINPFPLQW